MVEALTVLKIIGIVLLCVLAFIVLVLCVVLFVPVRYEIDAALPEDGEGKFARARFHWLFHLVRGGINAPEDMTFTVKALWFTVFSTGKGEEGEEAKGAEEPLPQAKVPESEPVVTASEPVVTESEPEVAESEPVVTESEPEVTESEPEAEESQGPESEPEATESEPAEDDGDEKIRRTVGDFFGLLGRLAGGVVDLLQKPYAVFEKLQCTISCVCGKIDEIRRLLESAAFSRAKGTVVKHGLKIAKSVLPRTVDVRATLGLDDPASTAEAFGVYSVLYPLLRGKVRITPDFDRSVTAGTVKIRGKVTVFRLVWSAAVCFFNKDIRRVIRGIKKIAGK